MTAAPPPTAPTRPRRKRALIPFFQDPEKRSVEIGIFATILIHLLLLLLIPAVFPNRPGAAHANRPTPRSKFNIEMAPPPRPSPAKKFVEANPNANNNIPDKTNNIAAQNQTAAQEKPNPKGDSDHAALEGRKDIQSTQVVSGTLNQEQERIPPTPQTPPTPPKQATAAPKKAQNPLSGFDKMEGETKDSFGTNTGPRADNNQAIPKRVEGSKTATDNAAAAADSPQIDPLHPRPRRSLAQHVRPAVFAENKVGTRNIGLAAYDAKWDSYAEYLQRLIESVQVEWDRILMASAVYPPHGSTVTVKFILDSKGRVKTLVDVQSTSSDQGKTACEAAITDRSPYGEWTKEMIATLGDQQTLTFTFLYE
ncbi:MAG TPA: hypothetical protein VHC86_03850 [Opitutaceae bacterium]|nr:hypothetical protein [Opitutaceae bacterium]